MNVSTNTKWRLTGEEIANCNCAWGCPCQFNALPTTGNCEALAGWLIEEGFYGDTQMAGVKFARLYYWPGPIHEGDGTMQMIIDEGASREQREALEALDTGQQGGAYFEITAAVCPNRLDPSVAPITLEIDRQQRRALLSIPDIGESRSEPIRNPVSGEEHQARIVLPNGFEYEEAEMGNTVSFNVRAGGQLEFQHENCYAQFNAFDWSNG